jgi:hypothetical protein
MSFFDTIINIKNLVTGGSAKVQLEISAAKYKHPFDITMRVLVADEKLEIAGAFLIIQSIEDIRMPNKNAAKLNENGSRNKEMISTHSVTSEQILTISEKLVLEANEKYVWNAVAELTPNNQPIYEGRYCIHHYRAKSYLDCYGNDPDSGWINLDIH